MADKPKFTVTRRELLDKDGDAQFRVLVHDMLAFATRIGEVEVGLAALVGLTQSQFRILISTMYLQGEDGVGVSALADHMHFSGPFVTTEVNKLVAQGLIDKSTAPHDRRRVRLKLTPEARRRLDELNKVQAPVNDVLFASVTREEFLMLSSVTSRLVVHGDESLALLDFYMTKTAGQERK